MMTDRSDDRDRIPVRRHRIAELDVYEISGEELEQLELAGLRGAEAFGFAIFGLSVGISLLVTLVTVEIGNDRVFYGFLIGTILFLVMGGFFGLRWLLERQRSKPVAQRIKNRVAPIGDDETGTDLVDIEAESERPRIEE